MTEDSLKETPLGTVIRSEWSSEYYLEVVETEKKAMHAICGAPKKDKTPCKGRPKKKWGYYCVFHQFDGEKHLTATQIKHIPKDKVDALTKAKKARIPVLMEDEVQALLTRCNICQHRRSCSQYLPHHYCRIERRLFDHFVDTVKEDYQIDPIDEFMVIQAGFSWINAFRGQMAKAHMSDLDAEATRISWIQPRQSKEYRESMKALGLTRKERMEQQKEELGVSGLPLNASLAQIMSNVDVSEMSLTVKKKDEEHIINVEETKDDEQ